jgi:hypothetical protein
VLHEDLKGLIGRLDRIAAAIDAALEVGGEVSGATPPEVLDAMVDTCWESVRIGNVLTRSLAYADLWNDLDVLVHLWRRIDAQAGRVRLADARAVPAASLSRSLVDGLRAIADAVAELDDAQLVAVARPRDREAVGRADTAIAALEAAADRLFVAALLDDRHGRLDAALAVLTTVAARAARERAAVMARRG